MKIVLCTTPIRSYPTSYPPFGSMAIIQNLRLAGYDPYFYDIDGLRPGFEEVVRYFENEAPDVVGISAVVSTAYAYTKDLALAIKRVSPNTKIVVGGNLAASSELLLRFCGIDVCAVGEGERTMVQLVKYWDENPGVRNYSTIREISGITLLDDDGEMEFTGYAPAIPAAEFLNPDWSILEQFSDINLYVNDPLEHYAFAQDARSYETHRQGKKWALVNTAKGCVARCTFCHRWDKGYRRWAVDQIIENIEYLIDRYNVGFISFADENFGSDRNQVDELLERLEPLDILFRVGGVRVASVDQDLLKRLKDSGCTTMYYGMETGSPSMLQVMEKNATLQKNVDVARWTYEAGIYTIYQMVLGMPGESESTIAETRNFLRDATEFLPEPPHTRLSINYIQALPGTPVYEYARSTGLIGSTLEEEEKYLIEISDIDAGDDSKFLNFTGSDYVTVQSWRQKIIFDAEANWYQKRGWKPAPKISQAQALNSNLPASDADEDTSSGGYFNLRRAIFRHPMFYRFLTLPINRPLRAMYPTAFIMGKNFKNLPLKRALKYTIELAFAKLKPRNRPSVGATTSLRVVMKERATAPATKSEESMKPLRDGR